MRVDVRRISRHRCVSVVDDVAAGLNNILIIIDVRTIVVRDRMPVVIPEVHRLRLISRPGGSSGTLVDGGVPANLIKRHAAAYLIDRRVSEWVTVLVPGIAAVTRSPRLPVVPTAVLISGDAAEVASGRPVASAQCFAPN